MSNVPISGTRIKQILFEQTGESRFFYADDDVGFYRGLINRKLYL